MVATTRTAQTIVSRDCLNGAKSMLTSSDLRRVTRPTEVMAATTGSAAGNSRATVSQGNGSTLRLATRSSRSTSSPKNAVAGVTV